MQARETSEDDQDLPAGGLPRSWLQHTLHWHRCVRIARAGCLLMVITAHCLAMHLTSRGWGFGVDQRRDRRVAA